MLIRFALKSNHAFIVFAKKYYIKNNQQQIIQLGNSRTVVYKVKISSGILQISKWDAHHRLKM